MTTKNCACCGQPFFSDPRVKNQTYCSAPECQKERRKKWRQSKMLTDKDYRVNKSDSQSSPAETQQSMSLTRANAWIR